ARTSWPRARARRFCGSQSYLSPLCRRGGLSYRGQGPARRQSLPQPRGQRATTRCKYTPPPLRDLGGRAQSPAESCQASPPHSCGPAPCPPERGGRCTWTGQVDRCHSNVYVDGSRISSQDPPWGGELLGTAPLPLHLAAEEAGMLRHEVQRGNEWKTPSLLQGGDEPLGRSVPGMQREGETAGPERYWCGAR